MMPMHPDPDPMLAPAPVVSDTLAVLVGGSPVIGVATRPPRGLDSVLRAGGAYYQPAHGVVPDSINFYNAPDDPATRRALLLHEFGHAFDGRDRDPELERAVRLRAPNKRSYAATNDREHFAEAFARGVDAMSATAEEAGHFDTLVAALDRMVPGTAEVVGWLRKHPLYAKHPRYLSGIGQALTRANR